MKRVLLLFVLAVTTVFSASQPTYWAKVRNGLVPTGREAPPRSTCQTAVNLGDAYIQMGGSATALVPEVWVCTNTSGVVYEWVAQSVSAGSSLPGTCTQYVTMYFLTDTVGGHILYGCTTTNNFSVLSAGGGGEAEVIAGTGIVVVDSTVSIDTAVVPTNASLQSGAALYVTTGGSSTVYTAAMTPTLAAYATGQVLVLKIHTASGATPTLNVDTLGAKKLYKSNGTSAPAQIGANELQATVYSFRYDAALDAAAGGYVVDIGGKGTTTRTIGCGAGDPAGSALATGVLCYVVAPVACTIQSWDILVDSGTATAGIWKIASGTAIPTVTNSIVASAAPAISTGTAIHSTTMTGWTTSVTQFDIFGFNLTTTSGPKYIYVGVNCLETL